MGFIERLLLALAIASASSFLSTTGATKTAFEADSWDILVTNGNRIYFFKNDTEVRRSTMDFMKISDIPSLAYDSVNRTMYISDLYNIRSDVVAVDLDSKLKFDRRLYTSAGVIPSIVFDPVTKTLFWIDTRDGLMKMEIAPNRIDSSPKISILHDLEAPSDVTLDICHRFIYWTADQGGKKSSIERSRLDGTDREEIITIDSPQFFYGLTVDHYGGKLYFGTSGPESFTIEESRLDGTDRRVLVNSTDHNVSGGGRLAVDDTAVYWTESIGKLSIWKMYKNGTAMKEIKSSDRRMGSYLLPKILTRDTVEGIDCKAVPDKEQIETPEQLPADNESQVTAKLEQLSNKMDRLLTNQNQLLLALNGILEDARLTHTAAISRIDALKLNLLDKAPHPEN